MKASRWRLVTAGFAVLMLLVEAAVRQAGLVDFPVYMRSDGFAYAPRSNQAGAFLGRNQWVFNDRSMGVERTWNASKFTDVMVIGNSIVMGGNAYDQQNKVGPLLQSNLGPGCQVWPIAAGGWSTVNEVRFLQAIPDVVERADFFIWELMAGQMNSVHLWSSETQHPTRRPWWATGYVVRKALMQRFGWGVDPPSPVPEDSERHYAEFEHMLGRLAFATGRRPAGMIFLYPDQQQLEQARAGREWMDDRHRIEQLAARHGVVLVDVAQSPRWTSAMYKDGVHPTPEGNRTLAALLAEATAGAGASALCNAGAAPRVRAPRAGGQ
jgi:hypothetical protein